MMKEHVSQQMLDGFAQQAETDTPGIVREFWGC